MPGDSAIKELNLRLGPGEGQGRGIGERLPGDGGNCSYSLPEPSWSAAAEPTSHHSQERYTKGVKQNPARARRAASKSSAPLPCVGACVCVCVHTRVCVSK